jgi:RHS repeat-associated protein
MLQFARQIDPGGLTAYTPLGFGGAYADATGLINLINRYYGPTTGQFLSVDPAVSLTQAPYSYANDDPVNEADPLGLWGWNPISDVVQAAKDTGHFVATHKKDIEIGAGVSSGGHGPTLHPGYYLVFTATVLECPAIIRAIQGIYAGRRFRGARPFVKRP